MYEGAEVALKLSHFSLSPEELKVIDRVRMTFIDFSIDI
jgi:hypothetical protein